MTLCQISANQKQLEFASNVNNLHSNLEMSSSLSSSSTLTSNNKRFTLNSSFNQNNRTKFAYRNYISRAHTEVAHHNEFTFNPHSFINKEEIIHETQELHHHHHNQQASVDIFSSLSSSSSSSSSSGSSSSSSASPTSFSATNCFDNSNYADLKALNKSENSSYLSHRFNESDNTPTQQARNDMSNFEDLQKAGMILRKALKEIKSLKLQENILDSINSNLPSNTRTNNNSNNDHNLSNSSSVSDLAFDNLTYFSSNENLKESSLKNSKSKTQSSLAQINSDIAKKTTLKSIKRKDKMKKNFQTHEHNESKPVVVEECHVALLSHAKSMPDLSMICREESKTDVENVLSNGEYEKRLRKMFRNKSLARSLRRAKSVYYRNRRSKSLENLSAEERITYLKSKACADADCQNFDLSGSSSSLRKSRLMMGRRSGGGEGSMASSCSSIISKMSDISSSYFHELSDWSPDFSSSESESSEEELFHNVDWDANLSNVVFVSCIFFLAKKFTE